MKKLYICFIILIFLLSSCYPPPGRRVPPPVPEYRVEDETQKMVKEYLTEVEEICQNSENLNVVGQSTMTQSARLIDLGKAVSPMLVAVLQDKTKHWKFRYWACDLLGYIEDERNILALVSVIEDPAEQEEIRLCAVNAIAEIDGEESIEYLEVAKEIVENDVVKEEIRKAIEKSGKRR